MISAREGKSIYHIELEFTFLSLIYGACMFCFAILHHLFFSTALVIKLTTEIFLQRLASAGKKETGYRACEKLVILDNSCNANCAKVLTVILCYQPIRVHHFLSIFIYMNFRMVFAIIRCAYVFWEICVSVYKVPFDFFMLFFPHAVRLNQLQDLTLI